MNMREVISSEVEKECGLIKMDEYIFTNGISLLFLVIRSKKVRGFTIKQSER